ncbi:MAG: haloacid dehalogenase [Gemmatimonadetes bacterium]|nr:haloacid dehalogenase [Gemmatimonadota bacterium]|tara:strand:+ start:312 stop:2186 length:1875 start_codon:yes stop_codon:yes gene_type:complete
MNNIYEDLSWLPQPPQDFSQRLNEVTNGNDLRELAKFSLDENHLRRLYKKTLTLQNEHVDLLPLTAIKIGVISNATTKLVVPALVGTALRSGISLQVVEAEFNQIAQETFSSDSVFISQKLDFILVAIDYRGLPLSPCPGDEDSAEKNVQDCLGYLKSVVESVRTKTGAQIILQNIASPVEALSGSYEGSLPGSANWLISRLNSELDGLVADDTFIVDIAGLAANLGLTNWHDPTLWNIAKLSFSQRYMPIYADYVCRIMSARLGKSRRCLILDLDNTLWGGVIGDDGLEGILIGNGDPTAEAHLHIQQTVLELRERGVVLAVSSKNEDATARQPFKEHPDMLLREEHIAAFQANWSDKASNIKAIAEMLSLGLESMVFLDDNPAERMQVRRELPEVAVPELPKDPALYARTLIAAGYFEAITFSEEDRKRATFYQGNAKRVQTLNQSSDMDAYLKSLDMEISFTPFDATGRARIAQLISKSNQFNLTTKRYSELDVKELEGDQSFYTRQIRLKDTFGDNGMISVIVCKKNTSAWEIDSWLMSCRVLGRRVELAALQDIVTNAKASGATKVVGTYIPTVRNIIVKDHYKKLGFTKILDESEIETWKLDISDFVALDLPMKLTYV